MSLDLTFNPNANNPIVAIALQGRNKIFPGGSVTTIGGVTRNRIARLNSDGTLDTGFNPIANNPIDAIAIQPDNKILLGGYFTAIGGVPRNRIARLNSDYSTTNFSILGTSMVSFVGFLWRTGPRHIFGIDRGKYWI